MEFLPSRVMCKRGSFEGRCSGTVPKCSRPPQSHRQLCLGKTVCLKAGVGRGNKRGSNAGVGFLPDKNYSFCCPKNWFLIKEKKKKGTITLQTFIGEVSLCFPRAAPQLWGFGVTLKTTKLGNSWFQDYFWKCQINTRTLFVTIL